MIIAKLHIGFKHYSGTSFDESSNIDYDITKFAKFGYDVQNMNEDDVWNMFADLYWPEQEITELFESHPEYDPEYGISISVKKIKVDPFLNWYYQGVKQLEAAE